MKKKTISFLILVICSLSSFAQTGKTGIATTSPQSVLDVNGDLSIRKKLYIADTNGRPDGGKDGQVLVSQGAGKPAVWKTLRIPDYEASKYYLIFNDSYKDFNTAATMTGQGVNFTSANNQISQITPSTALVEDASITTLTGGTNRFKEIAGLSKIFTVNSTISTTYFLFEAVVQHDNAASSNTTSKYACGIFVDDKLKSIRINSFTTPTTSSGFTTHTQIGAVDNLTAGDHTVKVACAKLASTTTTNMGIGVPATTSMTNMNNFMSQSSLKVDVYEIPQNFTPITTP